MRRIVAMTPAAIEPNSASQIGAVPSPRLVAIVFGVADLSAAEACFKSAADRLCQRATAVWSCRRPPGRALLFAFEVSR